MVIPRTAEIWDSSGQIDTLHPNTEECGALNYFMLIAVRPLKPNTTYTVHAGGVIERSHSIVPVPLPQGAPPATDLESCLAVTSSLSCPAVCNNLILTSRSLKSSLRRDPIGIRRRSLARRRELLLQQEAAAVSTTCLLSRPTERW